jgi:hypothetical protein
VQEADQPDVIGDFADANVLAGADYAVVDRAAADLKAAIAPEGTQGKARRLSRSMIDELGSAKSQSRPVLIYRN